MDSSLLSLVIVALIGYCLIQKYGSGSMLTWTDIGKILIIFAVVEGLMYFAPVPVKLVPLQGLGRIFGGGADDDDMQEFGEPPVGGMGTTACDMGLSPWDGIQGGGYGVRAGSVLDNVC